MTATPKETEYVSNIHYFGPPVYSYSLKQGIGDGFLAPYKVIRVHLDVDVHGWRPQIGETDKHGRPIDDRIYNLKDFDRSLVIDARTQRVARWISDYLKQGGHRMQKTIIFCVDTEHAVAAAPGADRREPGPGAEERALRHAHHRRRCRRHRTARQLHRPGIAVPGARHHLAAAVHRRRCADLPADRAGPQRSAR